MLICISVLLTLILLVLIAIWFQLLSIDTSIWSVNNKAIFIEDAVYQANDTLTEIKDDVKESKNYLTCLDCS